MTDPIRTPARLVVVAVCPSCNGKQALSVHLNAELIVSDEGSVLALKAKASKAEHLCDQVTLFDEEPETRTPEEIAADVATMSVDDQVLVHEAVKGVRALRKAAEATGTAVTLTYGGRSATLNGPAYTTLVADGETLDQALIRLEEREDYQDVIGSEAGQSLLEAIKAEGGAFVPFLTPEQLAGSAS